MNIFSKFYCRFYQTIFRILLPLLPYKEPKILSNKDEILKVLEENGIDNILLVTGKNVRGRGLTRDLEKLLKANGLAVSVFDGSKSDPTVEIIERGVSQYIKDQCQSIIALGGGSVMDCAKGIGARIACPNKSLNEMKGLLKVNHKLPLLIAIPTTAGTGSEVTLAAVIKDDVNHHKYTINDFDLIPDYALLDAKLTIGLPPATTATTGMDALTHAVEAYIGRSTTATTRRYSLEAIKLIFENLECAYDDGSNLQARKRLLRASHKAGKAFTKSYVGYIHAIAHTIGGKYGLSHGLANAVVMPYMLRSYGKSIYKKLWKIGKFCHLFDNKTTYEEGAEIVIKKIEDMNKKMNIPNKIVEIKQADIKTLAQLAAKEANPLYPVPKLYSAKGLEQVYFDLMR